MVTHYQRCWTIKPICPRFAHGRSSNPAVPIWHWSWKKRQLVEEAAANDYGNSKPGYAADINDSACIASKNCLGEGFKTRREQFSPGFHHRGGRVAIYQCVRH
jgi:hypothetical protein